MRQGTIHRHLYCDHCDATSVVEVVHDHGEYYYGHHEELTFAEVSKRGCDCEGDETLEERAMKEAGL